jgi:catechol 2,3-dioxygenase-like lactoylglutathione lyase family enzyme
LVTDAKKSAEWYRERLGFEVVQAEGHGVFVRPPGSQVLIHLCGSCEAWGPDRPGGRTGVWLGCGPVKMNRGKKSGLLIPASDPSEVERTYEELLGRGVEFSEALTTASWGKYAVLKDPDGNEFEIS